eukprot:4237568-Pyramimonas_sp.AAC.1
MGEGGADAAATARSLAFVSFQSESSARRQKESERGRDEAQGLHRRGYIAKRRGYIAKRKGYIPGVT